MLQSTVVAAVLLCLFALSSLPALSAQGPIVHSPTRFLHGWSVNDFAASRNPATPHLYYVVDGNHLILAIDSRDGRVARNVSFLDTNHWLGHIAVDNRDFVYVTAYNRQDGYHVKVFDDSMTSVKNVSLTDLQPTLWYGYNVQIAVDSLDSVYLFDSSPGADTDGQVWVLSPRGWLQSASWKAPIQTSSNWTAYYLMTVDSQDYLYFQSTNTYKMLYIADRKGQLQQSFQLGTGDSSDLWINDVAVDSHNQMWHTLDGSTYVTKFDSNGQLAGAYNVLAATTYNTIYIDVDLLGNVVVADRTEEALLTVSQQGDIINSLSSQTPPLWTLNELKADYAGGGGGGGRGNGSLLFSDYGSPYVAKRISVSDYETGSLLQRYSLPDRLSQSCYSAGLDVGIQTSNIYVLLQCYTTGQYWEYYSLVYVMAQSGRVVSEFRVSPEAYRIRADEVAGVIYMAVWGDYIQGDYIVSYSTVDGTQTANFTLPSPYAYYISDIDILPATQTTSAALIVLDPYNRRTVNFDTSGYNKPVSHYFGNQTWCVDLTFSLQQKPLYYISCYINYYSNGTWMYTAFIHRWDVTDPTNPVLTDTYVPPPGLDTTFTYIVIGLDQHLYAYEYTTGSVWQWRDADHSHPTDQRAQQPQDVQPRIRLGQPVMGAAPASAPSSQRDGIRRAVMPLSDAQNRHRHTRGSRSS